jgi:hypothetical protein
MSGIRYGTTCQLRQWFFILFPPEEVVQVAVQEALRRLIAERGGKNAKKRAVVAVARKLAVELVWRFSEVLGELSYRSNVTTCGTLRIITALSFRAVRPAKPHENHSELTSQQPGAARHWRSRSRVAV